MKISDKLIKVKFGDIKPYKNNPKEHDREQIELVKKSIERNDYIQPIVLWKNNEIIIGHCRYYAMKEMEISGSTKIEAVDRSNLTRKQADTLRILDNKSNESKWDREALRSEIERIFEGIEIDEIEISEIGFNINEIADAINFQSDISEDIDHKKEWNGMPEFENNAKAYKSLPVHFETENDMKKFAELINIEINESTKYIWFPYKEREKSKNKAYVNEI